MLTVRETYRSNMHENKIVFAGLTFTSSENLYQAFKSKDYEVWKEFSSLEPKESKKRGKKIPLREDWDKQKEMFMHLCLLLKFKQNPELKKLLLKTKAESIVELNTHHDNYWGICECEKCKDIKGENRLGNLLVVVRGEFNNGLEDDIIDFLIKALQIDLMLYNLKDEGLITESDLKKSLNGDI